MEDTRTLPEALEETYRKRWARTRSEKTTMSQARIAAGTLVFYVPPRAGPARVCDVTLDAVQEATAEWYRRGASPATINKRLNCLSAMGIDVKGQRVKEPKVLKWWLRPEVEKEVMDWLVTVPGTQEIARLITWTTRTGLRIEETLRLRRADFSGDLREVTVPGLKTSSAQATLALGHDAQVVANSAFKDNDGAMFRLTYEMAHSEWQIVRDKFGFDNPTATLKALRRSAARYLHYDRGMPLDMVRQYLRHENIETTMGYLRLTGGVSLEEQRRYLG